MDPRGHVPCPAVALERAGVIGLWCLALLADAAVKFCRRGHALANANTWCYSCDGPRSIVGRMRVRRLLDEGRLLDALEWRPRPA